MKKGYIILIILGFYGFNLFSQQNSCNVNANGVAILGYDVVAYFDNEAKKGKPKYSYTYKEVEYYFSSNKNCEKFKLHPNKYLPQYGGWCAYAMSKKGEKVEMDPKIFEIRDGKLYLFYKSFFNNTYKSWLTENPKVLKKQGDINWQKMNSKK